MKKIYLLLTFFILILFQGCQDLNPEQVAPSEASNADILDEVKDWYGQKPSGNSAQRNVRDLSSITAYWEAAKTRNMSKDHYMTTVPLTVPNQGRSTLQLVAFRDEQKIQGFIVQVIPSTKYALAKAKGGKDGFSGEIKIISKSGKKLKTFKFKDGKKQAITKKSTSTFRTMNEMWEVDAGYEIEIIGYNDDYNWDNAQADYMWLDAQMFDWQDYDFGGGSNIYDDYNNDGITDLAIPIQSMTIIRAADPNKIVNPKQHLKCFNVNAPAKITIFAMQPNAGSNSSFNLTEKDSKVGHSFISINQGGVVRTIGFYPKGDANPTNPSSAGVLLDDAGHVYNVGVSFDISERELADLLDYITNQLPSTYDLNNYNCTGFAIRACEEMGLNVPKTEATWPGGGGVCPATFGQDLRNFSLSDRWVSHFSNDVHLGWAPQNSGNCN